MNIPVTPSSTNTNPSVRGCSYLPLPVVDDSQRGKEHPQAQESRAKAESASREGIELNNLSGHGDQAKERRQQHQYLAARFSPVCPARRA